METQVKTIYLQIPFDATPPNLTELTPKEIFTIIDVGYKCLVEIKSMANNMNDNETIHKLTYEINAYKLKIKALEQENSIKNEVLLQTKTSSSVPLQTNSIIDRQQTNLSKNKPKNQGLPWTACDVNVLRNLIIENCNFDEIADKLDRTEHGVKCKICTIIGNELNVDNDIDSLCAKYKIDKEFYYKLKK